MKRCIVIGKPNVGKTLFLLNFTSYIRINQLLVVFEYPDKTKRQARYNMDEAVRELVGPEPHQTRCLQSITLPLPAGKGKKVIELIDTSGLSEGIHHQLELRRSMSQTLAIVRNSNVILHVIDTASVGREGAVEALGEVDYQVAQFAQMRGGYCILANKMDLPEAKSGLDKIKTEFSSHVVIPISALKMEGFREVRRFVIRNV